MTSSTCGSSSPRPRTDVDLQQCSCHVRETEESPTLAVLPQMAASDPPLADSLVTREAIRARVVGLSKLQAGVVRRKNSRHFEGERVTSDTQGVFALRENRGRGAL